MNNEAVINRIALEWHQAARNGAPCRPEEWITSERIEAVAESMALDAGPEEISEMRRDARKKAWDLVEQLGGPLQDHFLREEETTFQERGEKCSGLRRRKHSHGIEKNKRR